MQCRRGNFAFIGTDLGAGMTAFSDFLSGASLMAFGASSLFFLKFWRTSKDRFFLFFASATAILSLERIVLLCVRECVRTPASDVAESSSWVYLMRLVAFVLIMLAIVDRNRNRKA